MDSETIIETIQDNIKTVWLNKPRRKNAIDYHMFVRLTQILKNAATDDSISMVVFTGTGDFYSSGNDLVAPAGDDFLDILEEFIKAFITFPKLLIAIVNGPAVGVAVTTLPFFDFVFASENVSLKAPTFQFISQYDVPKLMSIVSFLGLLLYTVYKIKYSRRRELYIYVSKINRRKKGK